jgi:hypothetical protein
MRKALFIGIIISIFYSCEKENLEKLSKNGGGV